MKIAVIHASSQKEKNLLLFESVKRAVKKQGYETVNFGVFQEESTVCSYVEVALQISLLLESKAVDFAVTGCSSGQGMMLACNSLPGILCGYVPNPSDAYLFGRINAGNAASYPLGLNFGWAAEINLQSTMDNLFQEPFGCGYPKKDAKRKQRDTSILKNIQRLSKGRLVDLLPRLDEDFVRSALKKEIIYEYVMQYGQDEELKEQLQSI